MKLRYVSDSIEGFARKKSWLSFVYLNERGERIHDKATLARIRSMRIPPAYTHVWICPYENGHIQATAYDTRGRKQYIYHSEWTARHGETKFHRMLVFAGALSRIRRKVSRDLGARGMPKEKVLAAIVRLLDTAYVRIGNEEYAKENHSFGLTTLEDRHVQGSGNHMRLVFRGKSGVVHEVTIEDPRLRKIVATCQDLPGNELFAYLDEHHCAHDVTSDDINTYLKDISREEITAKDFRTWHGTVIASQYLWEHPLPEAKKEARQHIRDAIKHAADALGNTVSVCKKSYIHPHIFSLYEKGKFLLRTPRESLKKKYPQLHVYEVGVIEILHTE